MGWRTLSDGRRIHIPGAPDIITRRDDFSTERDRPPIKLHPRSTPNLDWSWQAYNRKAWPPDRPLTFMVRCWLCGDEIFVHSNGNGDTVLLDPPLGPPWSRHACFGIGRVSTDQIRNRVSWNYHEDSASFWSNAGPTRPLKKYRLPRVGKLVGVLENVSRNRCFIKTLNSKRIACTYLVGLTLSNGDTGEFRYIRVGRLLLIYEAVVLCPKRFDGTTTKLISKFPLSVSAGLDAMQECLVNALSLNDFSSDEICQKLFNNKSREARAIVVAAVNSASPPAQLRRQGRLRF